MTGISVIVPVVREDNIPRLFSAIKAAEYDGIELDIIMSVDTDRIGCPKMVQKLTEKTKFDLVCFLGDDCMPQANFLHKALKKMKEIEWGVVGIKTQGSVPCAHWLADKRILDLTGGDFFSTAYQHNFCDRELQDIAEENSRWIETDTELIKHNHPFNGADMDEFYRFGKATQDSDRITYFRRKRERYGHSVAIGFPLIDPTVPVSFFASYAAMDKPDRYTLLFPESAHGRFEGSIADARNSIVFQALESGCSHLLMMDTDQVYPENTLRQLLSNDKDVCGVAVHRRWKPYDRIFLRGEVGKYLNVPDEEAYSGDVIEVDATGSGCLLIKMEVFDRLKYPWFEFTLNEGKPVGEDINFCSKVRESGISIFVDTSIEVGHLHTISIGRWTHEIYKAAMKGR